MAKVLEKNDLKKVNIQVNGRPIIGLSTKYPLRGNLDNVKLKVTDIQKCIIGRAYVDEILTDGTLLRLDLSNYNLDNNASKVEELKNAEAEKIAKEKLEEEKRKMIEKNKADALKKAAEAKKLDEEKIKNEKNKVEE